MKQYIAVFNFSNEAYDEPILKLFRNALIKEFVDQRGKAIEKLNDMYETWNKEYNEAYSDNSKYNEFIVSKQQPFINEVNKSHKLIDLQLTHDGDIYARTTNGCILQTEIFLSLKEVES